MKLRDIQKLVEGTADPCFALDSNGQIAAWNKSADTAFGIGASEAIGSHCSDVLHGIDDCGKKCSHECGIQAQARRGIPLKSYDIQLMTADHRRWFNMMVTSVGGGKSEQTYTIHIAHPADLQKRFEMIVRDFVSHEAEVSPSLTEPSIRLKRSPSALVSLTPRETEILRLLAAGEGTASIANKLFVSPVTVRNHVQNILKKLNASSRLEAVRRAERAGLI